MKILINRYERWKKGYGKSTQGESAGDSGMCPDNVGYNCHVIWNVNADNQRMRINSGFHSFTSYAGVSDEAAERPMHFYCTAGTECSRKWQRNV